MADGSNVIAGTPRNDVLYATEAADSIVGNGGIDKVSYVNASSGVTASLFTKTGTAGWAAGDTYDGISNLQGSQFDDVLTGDSGDNYLLGAGGRDRLNGRAGNDLLSGGDGNDILVGSAGGDINAGGLGDRDAIDFSRSRGAVELSLELGNGWLGEASNDTFIDIEYVYGSAFNDTIGGDGEINRLIGNDGDDVIEAGGGNDYVLGGGGADTMTGGDGRDVFVLEAAFGNDTVTDFSAGKGLGDRLWFQDLGFDDFADVLANAVDTAGGVAITVAGHGVATLAGLTVAQLAADDFLFA